MSIRIFQTSDIHLGMKFAGYPEVQYELTEARFVTLKNLVDKANIEKCDLFVVSGDLFNQISVSKKDIIRSAQILSEFQGNLVAILPGNHDYITPGQIDLWKHFEENMGNNVKILKNQQVEPLHHYDLDVHLYPAPCQSKYSNENCIDWIKDLKKDINVAYHIGIAHGSLEGFSPDFNKEYYPMTGTELYNCGLDLWLMGHTHIQYPEKPGIMDKIFFPATPEPDGFDCLHEGKAWIIELDETKKINSNSISTGIYRFLHDQIEINNISDIKIKLKKYNSAEYANSLLKLKLFGKIPIDDYKQLPQVLEEIENQVFYLQSDTTGLTEKITPDIIEKEFTEDSFPYRLLTLLSQDEVNCEAIQIAYEIMNEVRE